MQDGKLKPGQVDETLVKNTYKELSDGTGSGYGKGWTKFGEDAGKDKAVLEMQRNLFRFSGAKSYAQLVELNNAMYKDGRLRSDAEIKAAALKINENYNINHLDAEIATAKQSGSSARDYHKAVSEKHLFPNMRFKTAGDRRVRESHRALEGLTVPIGHPFLTKYMTPLDWRCRCRWVQTAAAASDDIPTEVDGVKPEFIGNVGITNEVFPEKARDGGRQHPYFAILRTDQEAVQDVERQLVKNFREEVRTWARESLVKKGKSFKNEDLPEGFTLTHTEVKSITGKPHNDQFSRNNLLYNLDENFSKAKLIKQAPEEKGRTQYVMWYYFKDESGDFYYNVVQMADGRLVLHAITDRIQ